MLEIKTTIEIREVKKPMYKKGDVVFLKRMGEYKRGLYNALNEWDNTNIMSEYSPIKNNYDCLKLLDYHKIPFVVASSLAYDEGDGVKYVAVLRPLAYGVELDRVELEIDDKRSLVVNIPHVIKVLECDITSKGVTREMKWKAEELIRKACCSDEELTLQERVFKGFTRKGLAIEVHNKEELEFFEMFLMNKGYKNWNLESLYPEIKRHKFIWIVSEFGKPTVKRYLDDNVSGKVFSVKSLIDGQCTSKL